jgi:hypothetical protein
MYESERETIEAQYWDARDQVRQRLLGAVEERRRKLREEKEGGDIVTGEYGGFDRVIHRLQLDGHGLLTPRPNDPAFPAS